MESTMKPVIGKAGVYSTPIALATWRGGPSEEDTPHRVLRYTRQITLSREGGAPHRAEGPDIDVLLDALGDSVPGPRSVAT